LVTLRGHILRLVVWIGARAVHEEAGETAHEPNGCELTAESRKACVRQAGGMEIPAVPRPKAPSREHFQAPLTP
jgi:hypothetical protein